LARRLRLYAWMDHYERGRYNMRKILVFVACMVLLGASISQATSFTTTFTLGTQYSGYGGGSIDTSILGGKTLAWDYCMDYPRHINAGGTYAADVNTDGILYGASVQHITEIAFLLHKYAQSGRGTAQDNLQTAIWEELGYWNFNQLSSGAQALVNEAALNTANYVGDFYWITPYFLNANGGKEYVQAQVGPAPVPEPGTMMLLGMGMLGLAVAGRFRKNKA
jgi:hypothetical protein